MNSDTAYAQIFANEKGQCTFVLLQKRHTFVLVVGIVVQRQQALWIKAKRLFLRMKTAPINIISNINDDFEEHKVELHL